MAGIRAVLRQHAQHALAAGTARQVQAVGEGVAQGAGARDVGGGVLQSGRGK